MYKVQLTQSDQEALSKPVVGQGGFQDLLRLLKRSVKDDVLVVNESTRERIIRYAGEYGGGGWQERIARFRRELEKLPQQ